MHMLACSPFISPGQPTVPLTMATVTAPHAQLVHDIMTYFKEVGTGDPPAHVGVLWDPYHCQWVRDTAVGKTSCHSCYKAQDRCYDYLHSTTLPYLKATNSNLKRVFTH